MLLFLVTLCHCSSDPADESYPPCIKGIDDNEDVWCRSNPLAEIDSLRKVWGASANDVWAVGDRGAIVHWDGNDWKRSDSGTTAWLTGVWGSGSQDVWAVGDTGTILHWDGRTWSSVDSGTAHWLADVWGSGKTDVWTVGEAGTILHWDGRAWKASDSNTDDYLKSISGSGPDDIWTVGGTSDRSGYYQGDIFHWNGSVWEQVTNHPNNYVMLSKVWANAPCDVWISDSSYSYHWDCNNWSPYGVSGSERITSIWGSSSHDVWATGEYGSLSHWEGGDWTVIRAGEHGSALNAAWRSDAGDLWAVGERATILHREGDSWISVWDASRPLTALWGHDENDVWAVGKSGSILHWNGNAWKGTSSSTTNNLWGIGGTDASDVWAVGDAATILHWNGDTWTPSPVPIALQKVQLAGVWASSPSDAWAVGEAGTALHWNGIAWSAFASGTASPLRSISGSGPNDVWAAGGDSGIVGSGGIGTIVHWDGSKWNLIVPTNIDEKQAMPVILSIAHSSYSASLIFQQGTGRVYIDTMGAHVYLYLDPEDPPILSAWDRDGSDIWFTRMGGEIEHYLIAGSILTYPIAGNHNLQAIWRDEHGGMWAVGEAGTVLCHRPDGRCGAGLP